MYSRSLYNSDQNANMIQQFKKTLIKIFRALQQRLRRLRTVHKVNGRQITEAEWRWHKLVYHLSGRAWKVRMKLDETNEKMRKAEKKIDEATKGVRLARLATLRSQKNLRTEVNGCARSKNVRRVPLPKPPPELATRFRSQRHHPVPQPRAVYGSSRLRIATRRNKSTPSPIIAVRERDQEQKMLLQWSGIEPDSSIQIRGLLPPEEEFVPWAWRCHLCRTWYRISIPRCPYDGHRFCGTDKAYVKLLRSSDQKPKKPTSNQDLFRRSRRHKARCHVSIDHEYLESWKEWRENELTLRQAIFLRKHGYSLPKFPRIGRNKQNCWLNCYSPGACKERELSITPEISREGGSRDEREIESCLLEDTIFPRKSHS